MPQEDEIYKVARHVLTQHGYSEWMDSLFQSPSGTLHKFESIEDIDTFACFEKPSLESLDLAALVDKLLLQEQEQAEPELPTQPLQTVQEPITEPTAEEPEPAQDEQQDATEKREAISA